MKETSFIEQNKKKWHEFEKENASNNTDPDKLSELFVQMTEDLSYARTFYPKRSVRVYLNVLAQKVFNSFNKEKKARANKISYLTQEQKIFAACLFLFGFFLGFLAGFSLGVFAKLFIGVLAGSFFTLPMFIPRLRDFFFRSLPLELYRSRKQLLAAFLFFIVPVLIGVISSHIDNDFCRIILGDGYVDMTLDNIDNDDPMAVYKQQKETSMFLGITINNIRVAFMAFIFGVFYSVGTVYFLASNGIMLGAFQYFFKIKGLFLTSFLVIWIHGALEISAIVIAGCAGIVMGNGLLFPKTYSRIQSFQIHARRGMKILLGTVPLFIVAGFLEGFVTRHTEMADISKWGIILGSFTFIIFYFVIYPRMVFKRQGETKRFIDKTVYQPPQKLRKYRIREIGDVFYDTFGFFRMNFNTFGGIVLKVIIPLQIITIAVYFAFFNEYGGAIMDDDQRIYLAMAFGGDFNWAMFGLNTLLLSVNIATVFHALKIFKHKEGTSYFNRWVKEIWPYFFKTLPLIGTILLFVSLAPQWAVWLSIFIIPFIVLIFPSALLGDYATGIAKGFSLGSKTWGSTFVISLMVSGLCAVFFFFGLAPIWLFLQEFISWHTVTAFENDVLFQNIIITSILIGYIHILLPMFFLALGFQYYGIKDKEEAISLNERLARFGKSSKVYEKRK